MTGGRMRDIYRAQSDGGAGADYAAERLANEHLPDEATIDDSYLIARSDVRGAVKRFVADKPLQALLLDAIDSLPVMSGDDIVSMSSDTNQRAQTIYDTLEEDHRRLADVISRLQTKLDDQTNGGAILDAQLEINRHKAGLNDGAGA